jgi:phenylacetate-coenzyme A ligase PaaK-like adenylate-forming protein
VVMFSKRDRIFRINSEKEFNKIALEVFHFQQAGNEVYRRYCNLMHINPYDIQHYAAIPFLPIELFKSADVYVGNQKPQLVFASSGTTGQTTARHSIKDLTIYEKSFLNAFELFYGKPEDYCFLFLLPSYLERNDSSLVYMAQKLIDLTVENGSGFYLNNLEELKEKLLERKNNPGKKIVFLFGVTYALLDLAEKNIELNENFIVMETGGMKGKRKELLKEEVHAILKEKFSISKIHSEYGMTELLSQAYSKGDGIFEAPPWMKILIRDPYDPAHLLPVNKTGGINVIDLANIYSCSFIATQDIGMKLSENTFQVSGRLNDADLRGCNLMVE